MTDFDPCAFPPRLNLGCGFDRREGYLNVDLKAFHEPDLIADVRDLPMLEDGRYEEILAIDVLEHLPRTATEATLEEWRRLLVPGGVLALRVPSLEGLCRLFRGSDSFERHQELMQCLFGTQAYDEDHHRTCFTRVSLEGFLGRAGFSVLELDTADEWLFEVVARAGVGPNRRELDARVARLVGSSMDERGFLEAAYRLVLGRRPDDGGERFYLSALRSGTLDRAAVAGRLIESDEFQAGSAGAGDRR